MRGVVSHTTKHRVLEELDKRQWKRTNEWNMNYKAINNSIKNNINQSAERSLNISDDDDDNTYKQRKEKDND